MNTDQTTTGRNVAAVNAIGAELRRAQNLHREMASAHEGYAVILEELEELWLEVKKREPDLARMRGRLRPLSLATPGYGTRMDAWSRR